MSSPGSRTISKSGACPRSTDEALKTAAMKLSMVATWKSVYSSRIRSTVSPARPASRSASRDTIESTWDVSRGSRKWHALSHFRMRAFISRAAFLVKVMARMFARSFPVTAPTRSESRNWTNLSDRACVFPEPAEALRRTNSGKDRSVSAVRTDGPPPERPGDAGDVRDGMASFSPARQTLRKIFFLYRK